MRNSLIDQIVDEMQPPYIAPRRPFKPLRARYEHASDTKSVRIVIETDRGRVLFRSEYQKRHMTAYEDLVKVLNSQIIFHYNHDEQ